MATKDSWVREREFAQSQWLLDSWHIAQNVRTLVRDDEREHRRIMAAVWKSHSEAVLEALRTSPYRRTRPLEFNTLFVTSWAIATGSTTGT